MNIEQLLAHQLYIERLATNAVKNDLTPIMQEMYKQVRLSILESSDSLTSARALKSLKAQIRQIVNAQDFDPLTDGLVDLAKYESEFYADQLELEVDTDSVAKAAAASIMTLQSGKRFDSGLWSDFLKGMQESQAKAINGIVSTGYDRGWTANQMIREVKAQNEGLLINQAEALVRTGYAHHATVGRRELTRQNKHLIDREVPIVTFDNRTSDTCIGIDSRYKDGWPAGESPIGYNPYHFRCRTIVVPLTKGMEITAKRPSIGGKKGEVAKDAFEKRESRLRTKSQVTYRGRKDSNVFDVKQVDANTSYESWLKQQPRWFIEDTLGDTKANLFIDGKMPLKKFTDMTLRPLTLDELRKRDSEYFKRAGL